MSQATWEEVKRLAADLQRAQLSGTFQRLSDSNCIEIVNKLVSLRLLDIVHTTDGKEYLTEQEIRKEIREELQVHGGRINLSELQSAINIDYSHIEIKVNEMVRADKSLNLILGQLIDRNYTEKLADDMNDVLQEHGQLSIADLTKQHDLPSSFIQEIVQENLGSRILGTLDGDILFTDKFVEFHRHVVRGAYSGLTRPKSVLSVIQEYKLQDRLFHRVMDDLLKAGELRGTVSGGKGDKALYVPDIYTEAQTRWIQSFFTQNGYLEFDTISRLGVSDPKAFIKKLLKGQSVVYLKKCVVGQAVQDQVAALVEEALRTASWVDVQQYLPSCLSAEDASNIIGTVITSKPEAVSFEGVVVSKQFVKSCQEFFVAKMERRAREDIKKNPNLLTTIQEEDHTKFQDSKEDRRDQRKKKQATSTKSGGGLQGREVKMKSTKNKYRAGKHDDGDHEDDVTSARETCVPFMSSDDMETALGEKHPNCPVEMISDIVSEIHRPLTKQYHEFVKNLFLQSSGVASGSGRKKTHNDIQEKIGSLWSNIKLFEKGIDNFPEDVQAPLSKHLLGSLCSDVTNSIFRAVAIDNMMSTENETLTPEQRVKILSSMPDDDLRKKLTKLNQALIKSVAEFCDILEEVCGPEHLGILLRKVDKKKERSVVHGHKIALLQQLESELDPALALHLCVVILYQTVTGSMLHVPGKCVPHVITYVSPSLDDEQRQLVTDYQNDVIRSLKSDADNDVKSSLHERLPKIKELAATFKKVSKQ